MRVDRLPPHWQEWLRSHRPQTGGELRASDFKTNAVVRLQFDDGSLAVFNYAFYAVDEDRKELAVFTEHCGYHVFDLPGPRYETLTVQWPKEEPV